MKPHRRLYLKFILAYIIFAVASFLVVVLAASPVLLNFLVKDEAAKMYKEANLISNTYADYFYDDAISTYDIVKQLNAVGTFSSQRIWIINTDGEVIYDSESTTRNTSYTVTGFSGADVSNSYYITGSFFGHFKTDQLSVLCPITYNYHLKGYVVVHTSLDKIKETRNDINLIIISTVAIVFVLSTFILLVFTDVIYIPLRKITKATEAFAEGDFTYPIEVDKDDEMGYLASSLAYMGDKLSHFDEDQKKFIANVSHDFRSPLTSMKGYLEAMVDGTIPNEQHEKYLNIVMKETERLTKLTNNLLTLNNLNIKGMNLDISDFDINRVIKDTIATFEGSCKNKHIKVELVLTDESLYVTADLGKIQQVLYNLIDNAIKFSKQYSSIKIETNLKNETVFVSVKDSGIGIPKDSLKLIFDRFYKSDLSRGKDKKGTGLGLAIVKEIINAHHENINVISTVDVGTEFIFTLPKSKNEPDD